ncbi:MAG: thiamine pyrophosphate-binding protein [Desulfovermiculus sp.]|nr:thiamine pyrophosphate-binding protein [Desulfovermiculus sp.]
MNGAEVLVQMLQIYKVESILGVPGDTSIPLYAALHSASSSRTFDYLHRRLDQRWIWKGC